MLFEGFYGNQETKRLLTDAFASGRVAHALLLEGPRGCGKLTLAKLIAAAFLCTGGEERPCGICPACKKAFAGEHPDIRVVQGGAGARSFPVETVRRLRAEAFIVPNEGVCKVYILGNIQNMTEQAQNALLKILEEPPAFVRFILTCESRELVLETIRSRCAVYSLAPVDEQDAAHALEVQENLPQDEALRAARLAGGNIGRAKEALAAGGMDSAARLMDELAAALAGRGDYALLALTGRMEKDAELYAAFFSMLPLVLRDAISHRLQGGTPLSGCPGAAEKLARSLPLPTLSRMLEAAMLARQAVDKYANRTLLLTWLFSRLRAARSF